MNDFDKATRKINSCFRLQYEQFVGVYPTFKAARKSAREIARITGYYGYITRLVNKKNPKDVLFYASNVSLNAHYYVHKDGRVCSVEELKRLQTIANRHPETQTVVLPFAYDVKNRGKDESKKDYRKRMSTYFVGDFVNFNK